MSSILVVCTGNICRSPVGEAVLQSLLPPNTFQVSSAGTHAVVDSPAEPEVSAFLQRKLQTSLEHRARQLTKEMAESSDLILTMTEQHRSWVSRTAPRTVRRAFTFIEFAEAINYLPPEERFDSFETLVRACTRLRRLAKESCTSPDIKDPYLCPPELYESSFATILEASYKIANAIAIKSSNPVR